MKIPIENETIILFNEVMLQNAEVAQPVQKISRIETILMPPVVDKAGKPTGGKFRVDGIVGGKHYEITPTRNWNEMHVFDDAHQIETSKGKMALSDFLLKNVRGLTQLAIDQSFVTAADADVEVPYVGSDNKVGSGVEHPLKFLKGKNGKLAIPKNLTLEQTQNLMLLIFEKTKNTPDFAERDNKNGLTKILLEQIRNNYNKLGEAGKVPDDPKNPSGIFTEEPVFEALNIACRKAVEARVEEKAYSKTKVFERKGESRSQHLLNRLSIAAGIDDESAGGTARKQITKLQEIHQRDESGEKTSSLEFSVQMDLFMAQAFDVLVPAEVRIQMKKAQIEIDNTADYKKRADLIQNANKEKQMWRMAILNHFQVERTLPSKTKIPSIADEIRNPKIFSWEERMKIENDYTNSIANEISSLEKSRKDQGGLAELDLSSVNLIKTEQLLEQILPKTGRPEQRAKRVENALKELFSKTSEMIKEEDGKPPKKNTEKWDKYIKDTGLLSGLQGEQRELAKRAIEDALATQLSMEFKLQIASEKIGAPTKPTDVKFGSEINRGLKGVELLYRRGVSQEIPKGKRYESLDSKGKPNYKMVMDDYGVYHIQSTKEAIPNEDYRAIEASMSQTAIPKAETDQVPEEQKIKDEQAVELAKLLGFKEPITNEAEFRENMLGSEIFVLVDNQEGNGQHYEINVEILNLTSTTELNSLSHLSEFYPNTPVLVESLNLTISEEGHLETMPIRNFNIDSLILSGPVSGESETNIILDGGSCDYVEIRQGQFNISTDRAPIRVAMVEGHGGKASQMIFSESGLEEAISRNNDLRTEFLMGDNSMIQIVVRSEGEPAKNKTVYVDQDSHNESNGNTGKFILIQESGVYRLVDSEYKFSNSEPENVDDFASIIGNPPPPDPRKQTGESAPTPPPKPEVKDTRTPLEILKEKHPFVREPAAPLEERPVESDDSQTEIRKAAADLLKEQPLEPSQVELLEEVHTNVLAPDEEVSKRPGIRELWANRPTWLFRGKESVSAETAEETKPTRAEVVRARRGQAVGNTNRVTDPTSVAQSTNPADVSQADDTVMFETPANILEPKAAEKIGEKVEGRIVAPQRSNEDEAVLKWLEGLTTKRKDKIGSADESTGGGNNEDDESDLPDFLRGIKS